MKLLFVDRIIIYSLFELLLGATCYWIYWTNYSCSQNIDNSSRYIVGDTLNIGYSIPLYPLNRKEFGFFSFLQRDVVASVYSTAIALFLIGGKSTITINRRESSQVKRKWSARLLLSANFCSFEESSKRRNERRLDGLYCIGWYYMYVRASTGLQHSYMVLYQGIVQSSISSNLLAWICMPIGQNI